MELDQLIEISQQAADQVGSPQQADEGPAPEEAASLAYQDGLGAGPVPSDVAAEAYAGQYGGSAAGIAIPVTIEETVPLRDIARSGLEAAWKAQAEVLLAAGFSPEQAYRIVDAKIRALYPKEPWER